MRGIPPHGGQVLPTTVVLLLPFHWGHVKYTVKKTSTIKVDDINYAVELELRQLDRMIMLSK